MSAYGTLILGATCVGKAIIEAAPKANLDDVHITAQSRARLTELR